MSVRAIDWAFRQQVGSPTSKLVLVKLADNANDQGKCWPSLKTIEDATELCHDSVIRHIRKLEQAGLLKVRKRQLGGVSLSNVYQLNLQISKGSSYARLHPDMLYGGTVAVSNKGNSCVSQGAVAVPDTNRHVEPSIEPSTEPFLSKGKEKTEERNGASVIQHAEAKRLFGKLSEEVFEEVLRETQWPDDLLYYLDQVLPITTSDLEMIDWFYRLPVNHKIFRVTRRRQSLRAVLQNFRSEVQKIRSARKQIGLVASVKAGEEQDDDEEYVRPYGQWTAELWQAAEVEFEGRLTLPPRFIDLDGDLQQRIEERLELMKKNGAVGVEKK
jgi:hypothetical protein